MKAIKITEKNVDYLCSKFGVDTIEKEERFPLGYYAVTDFGNDETFDVITEAKFQSHFIVTEPELKNGWIGVQLV